MLHSKFSTRFDLDDQSVQIYIEHKVNGERQFLSPVFYFDPNGKLMIPSKADQKYSNMETFSYIARHVQTKVKNLKSYLEYSFQNDCDYAN